MGPTSSKQDEDGAAAGPSPVSVSKEKQYSIDGENQSPPGQQQPFMTQGANNITISPIQPPQPPQPIQNEAEMNAKNEKLKQISEEVDKHQEDVIERLNELYNSMEQFTENLKKKREQDMEQD